MQLSDCQRMTIQNRIARDAAAASTEGAMRGVGDEHVQGFELCRRELELVGIYRRQWLGIKIKETDGAAGLGLRR